MSTVYTTGRTHVMREAIRAVADAGGSVVVVMVGRAGSGKTTGAKYLGERYGFKPLSFASALKLVARDVMGFNDDQLYGPQRLKEAIDERYGMSPRTYLQRLGVAMREHVGPSVWVDSVINRIRSVPSCYAIDDCRFANEAGALVDLMRDGASAVIFVGLDAESMTLDDGSHESEHWSIAAVDAMRSYGIGCVKNDMTGTDGFGADIERIVIDWFDARHANGSAGDHRWMFR